jgi:hypothetical protein
MGETTVIGFPSGTKSAAVVPLDMILLSLEGLPLSLAIRGRGKGEGENSG